MMTELCAVCGSFDAAADPVSRTVRTAGVLGELSVQLAVWPASFPSEMSAAERCPDGSFEFRASSSCVEMVPAAAAPVSLPSPGFVSSPLLLPDRVASLDVLVVQGALAFAATPVSLHQVVLPFPVPERLLVPGALLRAAMSVLSGIDAVAVAPASAGKVTVEVSGPAGVLRACLVQPDETLAAAFQLPSARAMLPVASSELLDAASKTQTVSFLVSALGDVTVVASRLSGTPAVDSQLMAASLAALAADTVEVEVSGPARPVVFRSAERAVVLAAVVLR